VSPRTRGVARLLAVGATVALLALPSTLGGPARAAAAYELSVQPADFTFSPGAGAESGHWAVLWSTGSATAAVTTTGFVDRLQLEADADQCEGAPHLEVAVDRVTELSQEVDGTGLYVVPLAWAPGRHRVTFRFLDDHRTSRCDRNVRFRGAMLFGPFSDPGFPGLYTFQQLKTRYVDVIPVTAGNTTSQRAKLWNNGSMHVRLDSHGSTYLVLTIVVVGCQGRQADVTVTVDGSVVASGAARAGRTNLGLDGRLADGAHDIVLRMSRDPNTATCDGSVALTSALFDGNVPT
jgi:hypothetical protein